MDEHCKEIIHEIIIVDNASGDDEKDILIDWMNLRVQKNVKLIFSEQNSGFAAANNLAAKQAAGKYLFFLNPDTLLLNDAIRLFYEHLQKSDTKVVACGGNLLKTDLSLNWTYGNFPGILLELCNVGLGLSFLLNGYYKKHIAIGCKASSRKVLNVPYILGADMFIRAGAFNLTGGFDENFFMYYEETDLFLRFKKAGYESHILPEARIIHYEGGAVGKSSAQQFNYLKFEMLLRSKLYYYKKWYPGSLFIIKGLIRMQIIVQYLKGTWGNDLKRLYSIYSNINN